MKQISRVESTMPKNVSKKSSGRKGYGYLLFDFPADHEIEDRLPTECDAIRAVLFNDELGSRLKVLRYASKRRLKSAGAP